MRASPRLSVTIDKNSMRRLSIARLLPLALIGLTLALALLAALAVGALLDARQDYEDGLATSYAGEVAAANLLVASVVEERVVGDRASSAGERARAERAFARAVADARAAGQGDPRSLELVTAADEGERKLRVTRTPPAAGRVAMTAFARRQADRRELARARVSRRTHREVISASIAGALALLAALALVARLLAGM